MIKQNGLPVPVNPNEMFNLQEPDWVMFEKFSDNLKKKIISSPEYDKAKGGSQPAQQAPASTGFDADDDIPF
jgi:hypothetical protein